MNELQFLGAIELGLIYGMVALGVYLSFRALDFPDLTADGSFPLGAAIAAILISQGYNPWLSTLCAILGGSLAGLFTAWLSVRWKILNLLASILTMLALYSINLRIMKGPNITIMMDVETIFTPFEAFFSAKIAGTILILSILSLVIGTFLWYFLLTTTGLALRATGANPRMAQAQGIKTKGMILLGIAISNGLIALGGALFAQHQGFADVTIGNGTIIMGLAAVIIGEVVFPTRRIWLTLLACIIGTILHRFAIALALNADGLGLQATDLNLVTAGIVMVAMILPRLKKATTNKLIGRG
ncbi:MAG: ABC transporter permease [Candidatus Paracaedimonas acanthamoebae]|uniref:ABC transporter permease n=1 Tax=Candidatus Paracaedimonas acanthamoebae TaxID=244581 RepID=A0A8J7Q0C8_9PROT|nr:ABC transporter permease [Candidatus Paracaedimonas acanthamoebae]